MNKSNDYNIHYINEDGFTYLCLADASLSKATAQLFFEKFSENVRRQAISYGMYNQFIEYLKTKLVSILFCNLTELLQQKSRVLFILSVKATQVRKDPESRALKIQLFIAAIIVAMFLVIYLLY